MLLVLDTSNVSVVFQDIDTIYVAHNSKDLVLNDFDHLDVRYVWMPIYKILFNSQLELFSLTITKIKMIEFL